MTPSPETTERAEAFLSTGDIQHYRDIFRLQRDGEWAEADALIARLDDPLLIGHVQFQRYMHPTAYRSSFGELRDWLAAYADHPGAERIHALALRRKPAGAREPNRPGGVERMDVLTSRADDTALPRATTDTAQPRSKTATERRVQQQVRSLVHGGQVTRALQLLSQPATKRQMSPASMAEGLGTVVRGYYRYDRDPDAVATAQLADPKAARLVPDLHWWAGLAAWRSGNMVAAAEHFEAMTDAAIADDWTVSAAAFWAARANARLRRFERVNGLLLQAAQHKRTFYGLLASRVLGEPMRFDWNVPTAESDELQRLAGVPAVRRALALVQVGESDLADLEFRRFVDQMSLETAGTLLPFVEKAGLSSVAYRVGSRLLTAHARAIDAALYPVPDWRPHAGFTVDRALIYALIRQESAFRPNARSRAGAAGLMQLMPQTARFIGGNILAREGAKAIYDPAVNVELGQRYVRHLFQDPEIADNLIFTLAAYNGGPGNLRKWRQRIDYRDDPLLFIESIPMRETREFVGLVMANLWIYRHRLGQPIPSLDAVAAGEWPIYDPVDSTELASRGN